MIEDDNFEGSLILERLAELGKLDDFYEAVDSDDFDRAGLILKRAGIDLATIAIILKKMSEADD